MIGNELHEILRTGCNPWTDATDENCRTSREPTSYNIKSILDQQTKENIGARHNW
jgi:hypothetical protein